MLLWESAVREQNIESVKWLKGAELEYIEGVLVTWIEQEHVEKETAIDEIINEQQKNLVSRGVWQILYTKIGILLEKWGYSRDQCCIRWY